MKERPILFSAPMVRAILDGTKTQTRRVAHVTDEGCRPGFITPTAGFTPRRIESHYTYCPYGQPGDRLWVRETHAIVPRTAYANSVGVNQVLRPDDNHDAAVFREGWERSKPGRWRPSIHMPRWASRITLEIVRVRVERLHDISEQDAWAEGCLGWDDDVTGGSSGYAEFWNLWESINGEGSWNKNPWVWVVEFKKVEVVDVNL